MTPLNLMTMIAKSLTYPLKDVTGSSFCHIQTFLDLSSSNYAVFLSFFVTVFRYICLFQKEKLLKWRLNPKVSLTFWLICWWNYLAYHIVLSTSSSCLEAHSCFFRLKGDFWSLYTVTLLQKVDFHIINMR